MNAVPPEPADLVQRLRQQMILAQVRLMELEDERDELAPRVTELENLLTSAQKLADQKLEEAAHLDQVRAGLQAQFEHMRHMQHVTNEALNATRAQLAAAQQSLAEADARATSQEAALTSLRTNLAQGASDLQAARNALQAHSERIAQLDAELRALKTSRSWRWTAWLRALERALRGS